MKKHLTIAAGLIAGAWLMMATAPAMAHVNVDLNIGVPVAPVFVQPGPVYVQPGPVYVDPRYGWHERQLRERRRHERHHREHHHEHGHDEHRG